MRTLLDPLHDAAWALLCSAAALAVTFCAWFIAARSGAAPYGTVATLVGHLAAWSIVTGWERRSRSMTWMTVSSIAAAFLAGEFYGVRASLLEEPGRLARFGEDLPGLLPSASEAWSVLAFGFGDVPLHLLWVLVGLTMAGWRASQPIRRTGVAPLFTSMR